MKLYQELDVMVTRFASQDVITASGESTDNSQNNNQSEYPTIEAWCKFWDYKTPLCRYYTDKTQH